MKYTMKYLLLSLCGFEISDGLFTDSLVGHGLVTEANSLMEPVIMAGNFLLLKVAGAIICSWLLWKVYKHFPRLAIVTASTVVTFYGAVMLWNLGVYFIT